MRLRWAETQDEAFLLVSHDVVALFSSFVAIEDFLGWIQQILCCAGMVRGPSQFLSYPTSLSYTLDGGIDENDSPVPFPDGCIIE